MANISLCMTEAKIKISGLGVSIVFKKLLGMPVFPIRTPKFKPQLCSQIQLPDSAHPGRQVMAQELGTLPPMQKAWSELPAWAWPSLGCWGHLENEPTNRFLSLSPSQKSKCFFMFLSPSPSQISK